MNVTQELKKKKKKKNPEALWEQFLKFQILSFQDKDEGKVNTVHSIPAPWQVPSVCTRVPRTVLWRGRGTGCKRKMLGKLSRKQPVDPRGATHGSSQWEIRSDSW